MKRYIAMALLLVGCSEDSETKKLDLVPEVLYERHLQGFYSEAAERGVSVTTIAPVVVWATVPNCIGEDHGMSNSRKKGSQYIIEINSEFKVHENDSNFGTIIYREMAHLLLGKSYTGNISAGPDCPFNIMYGCTNPAAMDNGDIQKEAALDCLFN